MRFLEKIKQTSFWRDVLKIGIPFFIILVIISLLFNSYKAIFSGDFNAVSETNFNNGKWVIFLLSKLIASFIYGLYVTNKNSK